MNAKVLFILSSLFIAGLGLVKSLIFAKFLSFGDLGLLALFQSILALVAAFHLGLLSGGYRLASFYNTDEFEDLNSVVCALLCVLFVSSIVVLFLLDSIGVFNDLGILTYLGVFAGFVTLLSNWAMNISIAKGNLSSVNKAQLSGGIASICALPGIFNFGLYAAYFAVIIQPIVIILFLSKTVNYTLPKKLFIKRDVAFEVFRHGFFPFVAGLLFIIYQQFEKILVGHTISIEVLGHLTLFYLVFTVCSIVPDSLTRIYFPKATFFYENKQHDKLTHLVRQHFFLILSYSVVCGLGIFYFLEPVVEFFLVQHLDYVSYVKYGVVVFTLKFLSENPSIRLLSKGRNLFILYADLMCLFLYFGIFVYFFYNRNLSVEFFIHLSMLYYFAKLVILSSLAYLDDRSVSG